MNISLHPHPKSIVLEKSRLDAILRRVGAETWVYEAPAYSSCDVISVQGMGPLFQFDIVAPSGYEAKLYNVSQSAPLGVAGGFAMHFDLTVLPTNVSFHAIKIKEASALATSVSGYFADEQSWQMLSHSPLEGADVWSTVYIGNKCYDMAQIPELDPPWGDGGEIIYPIPNEYKRGADSVSQLGYYFCNTDQRFVVHQTGESREDKFGWFVSVTTNRVFTYGRIPE